MKYFTEITNNSESARKTLLLKTKFFLEYLHLLWHSLKQLVCIQVCLELPRPIKDKIHYGPNLLDKVFHIFMSSTDFCSYKSCNFFFFLNGINSVGSSYLSILGLAAVLHFNTRVCPENGLNCFDLLCACT